MLKNLASDCPILVLGPQDAPHRVWFDTGTHGQEAAPPYALARFAALWEDPWPWPNVGVRAVIVDPVGMAERGYGFIGTDGSASCWPPLWGYRQDKRAYWRYTDRNSAWGLTARHALPADHLALREALHEWQPTFMYSAHETVESEMQRHPFWAGAGLLTIEAYPLSSKVMQQLVGIPSPIANPVGFLGYLGRRWGWLLGRKRWERNDKILKENAHHQLLTAIAAKYVDLGGEMCGNTWMRIQEAVGQLVVGQGRLLHGPGLVASEWLLSTDYAAREFGCAAVTSETFQPGEIGVVGVDQRTEQTLLYMTAICEVLNDLCRSS